MFESTIPYMLIPVLIILLLSNAITNLFYFLGWLKLDWKGPRPEGSPKRPTDREIWVKTDFVSGSEPSGIESEKPVIPSQEGAIAKKGRRKKL